MPIHTLNFGRRVRVEHGNICIPVELKAVTKEQTFRLRGVFSNYKKKLDEIAGKLPYSPYRDKDGKAENLVKRVDGSIEKMLPKLLATCIPIEHAHPHMDGERLANFVLREGIVRTKPAVMTTGELLSQPMLEGHTGPEVLKPQQKNVIDVGGMLPEAPEESGTMPISHGVELYFLLAGLLRQRGCDSYPVYFNAYNGDEIVETPEPGVAVLEIGSKSSRIVLTSPNLNALAMHITGVRIMDDSAVFSYINLLHAMDISNLLSTEVAAVMAKAMNEHCPDIFERLGAAAEHGLAVPTPENLAYIMEMDLRIIGVENYVKLLKFYSEWRENNRETLQKLQTGLVESLVDAYNFGNDLPFLNEFMTMSLERLPDGIKQEVAVGCYMYPLQDAPLQEKE